MRFWKVGALKTKPFVKSQYKKWGFKLHTDYEEDVMKCQANERPMSMIMALDKFEFLYQNSLDKYDDDNDNDNDNEDEDDDNNKDNDSDNCDGRNGERGKKDDVGKKKDNRKGGYE